MAPKTVVFISLFCITAYSQDAQFFQRLRELPGVEEVVQATVDTVFFKTGAELRVRQPLDHKNPGGKSFLQSVYVFHTDFEKPVVYVTEGYSYSSDGRPAELTSILKSNQIVVEHRFFGTSRPDSLDWKYLTIQQASEDLHHIAVLLKRLYKGKWVSSGISKGGQTTLFYRYFFPDDVDVSVPYVAPVNLSQEDPRIIKFLRTVGTKDVREKLKQYQIALLKREKEILPLVDALAIRKGYTFSIGKALAYEYSVLEYPCGYWQYGHTPDEIPSPDAPPDTLLRGLDTIASLFYYSDRGIAMYEPFQYQAYTQIGYYGYDITEFRSYLTAVKDPTNIILAPKHTMLKFDPTVMYEVYTWLRDYGGNILYVYGETDLWGATAMELSGKTNAVKIVKPGGSHTTRINNLPPEQKELVYSTLEKWLGVSLTR
ncbi:MAG TPA: S28 family serine protease [Bacteroidota bacterium]